MTRIGIIGVGGFAGAHHGAVRALEETGEFRLICTCDPNTELREQARQSGEWERRGVEDYADYWAMLDAHGHDLDIVTVPTPIPLHAEMHRACVERGIACYLEKPPTLDPAEFARMSAVEGGALKQTQVAFNFIVETPRRKLKERVLAGEFGALKRVVFAGLWSRDSRYFARSGWAGKLFWHDGRLVLDSCMGNAMAHYLQNLLFWAGTDSLPSVATVADAEAELYRAHPIEMFDTIFLRATCTNGVLLDWAGTHACEAASTNGEWIECENATIHYVTGRTYTIRATDGTVIEEGDADRRHLLQENFRAYAAYVRGEEPRPLTRLADSQSFVWLNGLALVSAGAVTAVPENQRRRVENPDSGAVSYYLNDIESVCETFRDTRAFPSEQSTAWGVGGSRIVQPDDIAELVTVAERIRASGTT